MADSTNDFDLVEGELLDDDEMEALLGNPEEWYERFEGRYFGFYYGIVQAEVDPEKWGRIKVECNEIWGAGNISPWCEPIMSGSDSKTGEVWIPDEGAVVLIAFIEGDPDQPIWLWGPWFDSEEGLPNHAQGTTDASDSGIKGLGAGFIPSSQADPEYPYWKGLRTGKGHMIEYDDTPNKERVQVYHKSGSHLEFQEDGDIYLGATNNVKLGAIGGEIRFVSNDNTGIIGTEIGMDSIKGWLGQKTKATDPVVCGNILITYLTALHGILTTAYAANKALWEVMKNNSTWQSNYPDIVSACAVAQAAMDTAITGINAFPAVYFTAGLPTSFLSDVFKVAKLIGNQEA